MKVSLVGWKLIIVVTDYIYNHLYNFQHWFDIHNFIHCFLYSFLSSFSCKLSRQALHSTMAGMLCCATPWYWTQVLFSFDSFIMTNEISSKDQSLNVHSPYYLHPGENPSIAIVSLVLNLTNYNWWSRLMLTALSTKNKVKFVDGSIQKCTSNHLHAAWRRCNISWLDHSVSPSIRASILWMDNARNIWKDLKSRYSQGDLLRISELHQEMTSIR